MSRTAANILRADSFLLDSSYSKEIPFQSPAFSSHRPSSSSLSLQSSPCYPEFNQIETSSSLGSACNKNPSWIQGKTKVFHMQQDEASFCVRIDKVSFRSKSCLLDFIQTCGKEKDLPKTTRVHMDLLMEALIPKDVCITTALLTTYTKCGAMRKAQRLFQDIDKQNVAAWNALIAGYARNGLGDEAVNCFKCMQDMGISPNVVTFICISKACGSIENIEMGDEIYAVACKWNLLGKDIMLGNALIDMYAKFGLMQKAQEVFEEIPVKNVVTWNSLIGGYAQHELGTVAMKCFQEMLSKWCPPDPITLFWVLKVCDNVGFHELGEEIYNIVQDDGVLLARDGVVGHMLVDMFARSGLMKKA